MLSVTATFDDRGLQKLFALWMDYKNASVAEALTRAARVACRSFGESTWPKTLESGTNAVGAQVRRVYASLNDATEAIKDRDQNAAKAFYAFTHGKRSWGKAAKLLQQFGGPLAGASLSPFDGGTLHMRLRNNRGRIAKGMKQKFVVQEKFGKKETSALDRYISMRQANVGHTQSAWYNILGKLVNEVGNKARNRRSKKKGEETEITKPFPKWVQHHKGRGFGLVSMSDEPDRQGIVMHNNVPWSATALEPGAQRFIMAQSRKYLIKSLLMDMQRGGMAIGRVA